jgi:hypothetical protein
MLADWYWKEQDTVECATYGSELAAPRITLTDQSNVSSIAITLRRYQDVSVQAPPRTFDGNKESDVSSMGNHVSSHVKMHKRRNILQRHITTFPFHRVREAIGTKLMTLNFTPGDNNLDDVLSKTWNDIQVWLTLKPGPFLRMRHDGLLCSNGGPDSLRQMGSDKLRCVRRVTNQVPSSSIRQSVAIRASMDTARMNGHGAQGAKDTARSDRYGAQVAKDTSTSSITEDVF